VKLVSHFLLPLFFMALLAIASCKTSYQKISKSSDLDLKYAKAKEYYDKKDYLKAIPLLEELITIYKGSKNIDDLYYMYARSHYEQGDYLIAAFHFKNIHDTYPNSKYAEECLYLNAVCYYKLSPQPPLDQEYTIKAIEYFQLFANTYPQSDKLDDCNASVRALRRKLEIKAFNTANLYFKTGNYRAAATAFSNFIKDFPDSYDAEKAAFLTIKSYYLYARQSILQKQAERYEMAVNAYKNFMASYKNSSHAKEAEKIYLASLAEIDKLNNPHHNNEKK
jgi:outer membrane protein assembly factor BamD